VVTGSDALDEVFPWAGEYVKIVVRGVPACLLFLAVRGGR
jgi:Na+-driven multidrug efflux pump